MSEPVRVAVVGLGYWGPNLVRNLAELDEAELVAVCDLDPERSSSRSRYPAFAPTTSRRGAREPTTSTPSLIATPVSTHYPLGLAALAAGKHVFVEKPLAASPRRRTSWSRLARSGLVLMPGHTFLYSPPVDADPRADRERRARRHLLHLDEPREPRPPPARRERRLGPRGRTTSRSCATGSARRRRTSSAISRGCVMRATPTSRSSTSSSRRARSRTSSCRGSRRASCAGRRSSARRRWWSTTTRATSRCGSSTPASICAIPRRSASSG